MYLDCKNPASGMAGNVNPDMESLLVSNRVIGFPDAVDGVPEK
jgi:hypothetical protein